MGKNELAQKKHMRPSWKVKVSDHKSADHNSN
jgi:hypothetical protein